jgi:hypothetical protein
MGLQAPIELHGLGNEKGYWRLAAFTWTIDEPTTTRLKLNGYASKEAFESGNLPVVVREFMADAVKPDGSMDLIQVEMMVRVRELAYLEIKQFPDFIGAIDS